MRLLGLFAGLVLGLLPEFAQAQAQDYPTRTVKIVVAFPGDPYNRPDLPNGPNNLSSSAYVVHQVGGKPLR